MTQEPKFKIGDKVVYWSMAGAYETRILAYRDGEYAIDVTNVNGAKITVGEEKLTKVRSSDE